MCEELIYLDDQGGSQMQVLRDDVSPCILLNGAKAHALIVCERKPSVVAFAQNTREEVRILGDDGNVAGCVSAESGTHQTTYLAVKKKREVPCGTRTASRRLLLSSEEREKFSRVAEGSYFGQIGISIRFGNHFWREVSGTVLAGMQGDNLPTLIKVKKRKKGIKYANRLA